MDYETVLRKANTKQQANQTNNSNTSNAFSLNPPGLGLSKSDNTYEQMSSQNTGISQFKFQKPIQQKGKKKNKIQSAINWYKTSKTGQKVKFTQGLVEEMYKAAGSVHAVLYVQATIEGEIGEAFVRLAMEAQKVIGTKPDGKIGPKTIAKHKKWKTGGEKGIDYGRLFKDKKLEIGIGTGADIGDEEAMDIRNFLLSEKFKITQDDATKTTFKAKRMYDTPGDNTAGKMEIEVIIDLVTHKNTDAKNTFGSMLTDKEIAIYSGHARYGTGPDFDAANKTDQNFVLGVNSDLHKKGKLTKGYNKKKNELLKGKKNDLEKLSKDGKFDMEKYQVWLFNACSSRDYLDEIRGGLVNKDGKSKSKKNLRVVGTNKSIYTDALPFIKGLLKMETMDQLIARMNTAEKKIVKANKEKVSKNYFFSD